MFDFAPQGPEPEIVTVLRKARALVATPEQWCQGAGYTAFATGPAHCLSNAIFTSSLASGEHFNEASSLVHAVLQTRDIVNWNDAAGRTHAEVLDALDRAIAYGLTHATQRETVHV